MFKLKSHITSLSFGEGLGVRLFLQLPSNSRCSEYSSAATLESAKQEFSFTLEHLQHVLIIATHDRVHNQVASLCHTSEEDESLRTAKSCEVGTSLTKHFACEVVYSLSQSIAIVGSNSNIERSDSFRVQCAQ